MNSAGYAGTLLMLVLAAVCPTVAQTAGKPLCQAQGIDLLENYVPPGRVAEIARRDGIDLEVILGTMRPPPGSREMLYILNKWFARR